jgi:hypothetical protein
MLCGNRALRDRKLRQIAQSHAMTSIVRNTARGNSANAVYPSQFVKCTGLVSASDSLVPEFHNELARFLLRLSRAHGGLHDH